jgi:hypothetical protein
MNKKGTFLTEPAAPAPVDISYWTNCRNCGHQIKLDGDDPDEKCYFCRKPALKKKEEKTMVITPDTAKTGTSSAPNHVSELPPVPPKPDTAGMPLGKRNMAMKKYWDENRVPILHDADTMREKLMLERWKMSMSTWMGKRHQWRPEKYGEYGTKKVRKLKSVNAELPIVSKKKEKTPKIVKDSPAAAAGVGANVTPPEPDKVEKQPKPANRYISLGTYQVIASELPPFPAFNEAWSDAVKIAWFTYFTEISSWEIPSDKGNWFTKLFKKGG